MDLEKIFANNEIDKDLISKIDKELIQLNSKQLNIQSKNEQKIFLQRRHMDDQQAYEKMFNIANY